MANLLSDGIRIGIRRRLLPCPPHSSVWPVERVNGAVAFDLDVLGPIRN